MGQSPRGPPLGDRISKAEIDHLRREGKIAYPEDLDIDRKRADKDLLAAKSLEEIREISGGLYEVPEKFRQKQREDTVPMGALLVKLG